MSALTSPVLINQNRAYWLSSIQNDVIHSTIQCQEIDANLARFSTVFISDQLNTSTLNASSFKLTYLDLSEANISTLRTNAAFTSSQTWASDLSGGVGYVRISTDASGVQVDGDPIRFDNLVYFTSTITIVPVSTIIDTDIFAQNGYFSTLSSGSISSGALQTSSLFAHQAVMSTLTVSSITTTDISGFEPSSWSLYPTLNSSITFQPGNVLSNIGNKLFFAGQELTDSSGGGANWSAFPALQDVSMNNFSLRALSTLQYQDGARLYSQTGNNLFYNGQPISYGPSGNASNWSQFPAKTNITAGQSTLTVGNIQNNGSNITNGNTFTNSLGVGGLSLVPIASISAGGDLSVRNIEVGDTTTSVADVNIYGENAVPGDTALYVEGGVQFDGGLVHGFSAGLLPVAGINTGRIDMLQAGFNLLHPLVGVITTGTAMSLAAGGAMSLAAGAYIETNTSTIQCINTSQGNKNTTLQTGFLTIDPDLAPTSSIKLFNVLGGGVEIDGGGQGSLQGFSTVQANNLSSFSTVANTVLTNFAQVSTIFYGTGLAVSTTIGALRVNNIKIADDITGVTNAPMPLESRIVNFSSINSFAMSTTDLWVSSINGAAPGGGGGGGGNLSTFQDMFTSSAQISTLVAPGFLGAKNLNITADVITFKGTSTSPPTQSYLSSLNGIITAGQNFEIRAGGSFDLLYAPGGTDYIRIGGGGADDVKIRDFRGGGAVSTSHLMTSSIIADPVSGIDISGTLFMKGGIDILQNQWIGFNAGANLGTSALVNTTMPCFFLPGAPFGCNLGPVGANQFYIGSGTGAFGAAKLYCEFPGDNWGIDIIDANGTTLFETINCYDTTGFNFQTNVYGVSSIVGFTANAPGSQQAVGIQGILTADQVSTTAVKYTSTLNYYASNTDFNYPLVLEHDAAGSGTAGMAMRLIGTNLTTGAVVHELQMGWRAADGANYIQALWPGHNLEDLSIEAAPVSINDGALSTVFGGPGGWSIQTQQRMQLAGDTIITPGVLSTPSILVSSINGNPAPKAFTNNLMLSTMELYAASTTLMYWDSTTTSENINTSAYDAVVGVNGNYKIGASFQFLSGGASDEVEFFILKNDAVISQSGGIIELENNAELVSYVESIESLVNGDKIQIGCYTSNANVFVSTINGNVIQSPACILTMYKVD
jgi:hypothetical protein